MCQVLHPLICSCRILLLLECLLSMHDIIDHFDKIQYVNKLHVCSLSSTKVYNHLYLQVIDLDQNALQLFHQLNNLWIRILFFHCIVVNYSRQYIVFVVWSMGHKNFWSIFYWLFESMYATLALFSLCLCTPMLYTGPSLCCGKNHE